MFSTIYPGGNYAAAAGRPSEYGFVTGVVMRFLRNLRLLDERFERSASEVQLSEQISPGPTDHLALSDRVSMAELHPYWLHECRWFCLLQPVSQPR
jgi:hypothetical protein